MKTFLVTLKIDNGATFKTVKFLVHAETDSDAIEIAAAACNEFAGYEDFIVEEFAEEFKEDKSWMLI